MCIIYSLVFLQNIQWIMHIHNIFHLFGDFFVRRRKENGVSVENICERWKDRCVEWWVGERGQRREGGREQQREANWFCSCESMEWLLHDIISGGLILFSLFLFYHSFKLFSKTVIKTDTGVSLNDAFHISKCHSEYAF